MADIQKTIQIIFGASDNTGSVLTSIGDNLSAFEGSVGNVTGPLANLTENLLKTEAAVLALAAAYGGYALSKSIEFENAQIDLAKVLSDTDPSIDNFTQTVIDLSEQYGIASSSILQGIANFKQAGFTAEEAAKLQKDALDLVIAGDVDAANATEILISSIKGFNATAAEAPRYIEAMNNVSNQFATDLGELATGMSRVSPIAKTMGFTFEETTGLITPVIEVFRSGSEASNALKTGLLKLIDDAKPVGEALAKIGVSQFDLNGEMRSGRDIFYDVAKAFETLDENQKLVITSQLVGIDQAAKMVTVFDNLAKSQEITAVAMKETGSATEEVALRLASASSKVDQLGQVFSNLAKSVGDELKPAFNDTVDGTNTLLKAFRDVVDSGGLAPLFEQLDAQGLELKTFLQDVAEALPNAFNNLDFNDLIASFQNLKDSVGGLFNDLDLTKPEDLTIALQGIIDFLTLLNNASSGAIQGLKPLLDAVVTFLTALADSESGTQTFIGNIGGIATSIDKVLPLLSFLADAVVLVGGALTAIGGVKAVESLGSIVSVLNGISPTNVALAAAIGSVTFAITENIKAYDELQRREREIAADSEHLAETNEKLSEKLLDISNSTGASVTNMEEFNRAVDDGILVFDKATGEWTKAGEAVRDFDAEVAAAAASSSDATNVTEDYIAQMRELGIVVDPITGKMQTLEEAAAQNSVAQKEAADSANEYKLELIDGIPTYSQVANAQTKLADTSEETAKAVGKLTEQERLAIEQAHEMETTLLELASNERIANMKFSAEIEVAKIDGQAKQMVAAFDAIAESVSSTNDLIGDLFSHDAPDWDNFGFETQAAIDKAQENAERLVDSQVAMNDAQIRYLDAQVEALNNETVVSITADGLEPEIEAFMFEILRRIQTKVAGDREAFLLGAGI